MKKNLEKEKNSRKRKKILEKKEKITNDKKKTIKRGKNDEKEKQNFEYIQNDFVFVETSRNVPISHVQSSSFENHNLKLKIVYYHCDRCQNILSILLCIHINHLRQFYCKSEKDSYSIKTFFPK